MTIHIESTKNEEVIKISDCLFIFFGIKISTMIPYSDCLTERQLSLKHQLFIIGLYYFSFQNIAH